MKLIFMAKKMVTNKSIQSSLVRIWVEKYQENFRPIRLVELKSIQPSKDIGHFSLLLVCLVFRL